MTMTRPAPSWSVRVITVRQELMVFRGRAAEFRQQGMTVWSYDTAEEALLEVARDPDAVVLVPTELPDMDVVDFIITIRALGQATVVLGLTPGFEARVVSGAFLHGAIAAVRLPATAQSLAQAIVGVRPVEPEPERLQIGDLVVDVDLYRVLWRGRPVDMAPREFELLRILMTQYPRPVTSLELVGLLGYGGHQPDDNVRRAIRRIRDRFQAIDPTANPIRTVHRIGYRIADA